MIQPNLQTQAHGAADQHIRRVASIKIVGEQRLDGQFRSWKVGESGTNQQQERLQMGNARSLGNT